jgi:hypothetical protein
VTEPTPTKGTEASPEHRPWLSARTTVTEPTPTKGTEAIPDQRPFISARQHSDCMSPRRPKYQRPEERPQLSYPQTQWVARPTPTERTETRATPSSIVPASTVADRAKANRANRGQNSALTYRARQRNGWLSPRRTRNQRPEQRPHLTCPRKQWLAGRPQLSCLPPQWLYEPTPTELTEARAANSPVVPFNTEAG